MGEKDGYSGSKPANPTTTIAHRQTTCNPSPEPNAAHVEDILATIRLNLALVEHTWGRESRQHREARGVMLAYLEENVLRHRHMLNGQAGNGGGDESRDPGGVDVDMDLGRQREVERGIEEVLAQLRLS
ncbi:uncharacterized protein PV07_00632 [Cladophialophora immunda]|uniref:Uncharacterized protein n=1 Tax=Cladophialophora immunda TaxID=569365 RepID=A0A0D2A051_9EURO|nr:uncharacterized protein PV07_00632 [Cladophialophora immunda]KIW33811.1 hypothetical protein PV07_00632 [Cladophialophora immunda]OQU94321.1 hypothetical protein CLAIMM_00687 [Cladophialophora immunda]